MLLILFRFIETQSAIYRVDLIIWNRNCVDIVLRYKQIIPQTIIFNKFLLTKDML